MELLKKSIHMNRLKDKNSFNITVDEDCVIPDSKPDVVRKIRECGNVCVEKVRAMEEKAGISGVLAYSFLYSCGEGYASTSGKIPFEEIVQMQGVTPQDILSCKVVLEDLKISVVNSRKISIRAIISVTLTAEEIIDRECVEGIAGDDVKVKNKTMKVMRLCGAKRDTFRVRESVATDRDMGNIGEVIWYELEPCEVKVKCTDEGVEIKGVLNIFVMYSGEMDRERIYCYKGQSVFGGMIPMSDWSPEVHLIMNIISMEKSLITRGDANGENRIFDAEILMTLDIRGYVSEKDELPEDMFSPKRELELISQPVDYRALAGEKEVECKITEKFKINNAAKVLNTVSKVFVEDVFVNDRGINAEGIVNVELCYHTTDEKDPVAAIRYAMPFSKTADYEGIAGECMTEVGIENVRTDYELISENEIKIEVTMTMNILTCCNCTDMMVTDVKEHPVDINKIKCLPGLTGYIVQKGDTLWNIAKRYHTTVESIMEINKLTSEEIYPGMKLIVVKLYCY